MLSDDLADIMIFRFRFRFRFFDQIAMAQEQQYLFSSFFSACEQKKLKSYNLVGSWSVRNLTHRM